MKVYAVGVADPFCPAWRLVWKIRNIFFSSFVCCVLTFFDVILWAYLVMFLFAVWFADDLNVVEFIVF
jgi:hypothetical protein